LKVTGFREGIFKVHSKLFISIFLDIDKIIYTLVLEKHRSGEFAKSQQNFTNANKYRRGGGGWPEYKQK